MTVHTILRYSKFLANISFEVILLDAKILFYAFWTILALSFSVHETKEMETNDVFLTDSK